MTHCSQGGIVLVIDPGNLPVPLIERRACPITDRSGVLSAVSYRISVINYGDN